MEDIIARSVKRAFCRHGADNSLEFITVRTDTGFTVKATQTICKKCLEDLGASLIDNNRLIVAEFERAFCRSP
jgi:RNase P subunit RPR2